MEELEALQRLKKVKVHSISTHLPVSDEDADYTRLQLNRFGDLAIRLRALAPNAKIHVWNSAGILGFPGRADPR